MKAEESYQVLQKMLVDQGEKLETLTMERGFQQMFEFYRTHRAEDCPPENDGDMLLFQWGKDSPGTFEISMTRQFVYESAEDEDIWQLALSFQFSSTTDLDEVDSGNKWCETIRPRAVDYFETFVKSSPAYQKASELTATNVSLDYFEVG